jgi:DNA-binding HxlR family transcriptional regulator
MIQLNNKTFTCPVDVLLGLIGGKWKLLILSQLYQFGHRGYGEMEDNLPNISEKMLSQQLKQLEKDMLIQKKVLSLKPYRVEYSLTPRGQSLSPLFQFASSWGISYLKEQGIDYVQDQHLYK